MSHPSFGELGGEDPYAILGLSPRARDDDILRARRRLLRRYHPDLPGGDLERTQMITAAADILLDRARRMAYEDMARERDEAVFAGPVGATRNGAPSLHNPFEAPSSEGNGWHPTGWLRERGSERPASSERPPGETLASSGGSHRADGGAGHGPRTVHTPWDLFEGQGSAGPGVPKPRTRPFHDTGSAPRAEHAEEQLGGGRALLQWCWLAVLGALERLRHWSDYAPTTISFGLSIGVLLLVVYVLWALVR
jgi:curved DNA-binding protein CbpA